MCHWHYHERYCCELIFFLAPNFLYMVSFHFKDAPFNFQESLLIQISIFNGSKWKNLSVTSANKYSTWCLIFPSSPNWLGLARWLKINLTQITLESFLLFLISNYAENCTHLAQAERKLASTFYYQYLLYLSAFFIYCWWVKCVGFIRFLLSL